MKGRKVLKWALGIFMVLIILIALFGEDKQTQQSKQEQQTASTPTQQQTRPQAQPQQPQNVDYEKSVFSKEIVDAIVDKLSPLRAKGYTIKTDIHRGVGEFSKNFTYYARIEKNYKELAYIDYKSAFHNPNMPPSPSSVSVILNCHQERGLLYGCADPKKDLDGFLVIKSLWDVVGLKDEDLSKVLSVISSAYKKKNLEDTTLMTELNLTGANGIDYTLTHSVSSMLDKGANGIDYTLTHSVSSMLDKGANGIDYTLTLSVSFMLDKEGDRVVIKPIVEYVKLGLYERR